VQVTVERPDVKGRVEILKVHSKGKTLGPDVDLEKVARRTPGFTGERSGRAWLCTQGPWSGLPA
jgi:ATP-dependent Zn protease